MDADGKIIIGTEVDTTGVEDGVEDIKDIVEEETPELDLKVKEQSKGMKAISNFATKIGAKFLGISATTLRIVKNIAKFALKLGIIGGLIGIVALAGLGIANAFSEALDKDKELETQLKYLKFAITSAFQGIGEALVKAVKWVVNVIYKAIIGLGAFIKLLTGKNIFKRSGIKDFEKSLATSDKNAKSLQKTLAGFDEAQVLGNGGGNLADGILGGMDKLPDISKEVDKTASKLKETVKKVIDFIKTNFKNLLYFINNDFLETLRKYLGPVGDILYLPFLFGWTYIKTLFGEIIKGVKFVIEGIKDILNGNFVPGITKIFTGVLTIMLAPFKALTTAVNTTLNQVYNSMLYWANKVITIFDKLITPLKKPFQEFIDYIKGLWNKIAQPINDLVNKIKKALNFNIDMKYRFSAGGGSGSLGGGGSYVPRAKGGIYYPKLGSGGIISQPGRGIPYHGAIIGERGAEAVLPLTDSQQMQLLGEAIGRYIVINANIVNTMNGRVISKELQKVQNDNDFAYNR